MIEKTQPRISEMRIIFCMNKERIHNIAAIAIFVIYWSVGLANGQTPAAVKPVPVAGDIKSISATSVIVGTRNGPVDVALTEKTVYKRAGADFNLAAATAGAFADMSVGDKVTISALPSADGKSFSARTVYFVANSDIAAKNAARNEDWRKRGITGRVTAVNPQTNQIDVELRSLMGSTKLAITPKDKAKFLRYAEDSIRYDEAKPSSIGDIKAGDMFRALGDRSSDGATFAAEEIITGAFQTIAGTVKSVNVEKKEVLIKNLQTGKDVTVVVGEASVMKKFPAEMAERMAGFQMGGGGVRPVGAAQGAPLASAGQGQAQAPGMGRGGFGGGGRGGNIDDMLDRFPNITPADLKPGDMIAFSSTKNGNVDRMKAIKLLAGVEPFLRMAQAANGNQRSQGVQGAFTIPGLDGVGF